MSHPQDSESGFDPVLDLVHHVFHLKLSIDTYPNQFEFDKESLKSLLVKWSNVPFSIWKKFDYIKKLNERFCIDSALIIQCIYEIVEECSSGTTCRLSSSSAGFYLLVLDSCSPTCEGDLKACLVKLTSCIDFNLAKKISLSSIKSDGMVKWNDLTCLKLLHFFPFSEADWSTFGKFLSELKGLPDQFRDLIPYFGKFFIINGKNSELAGIVERLSRRNSSVAAAILALICANDSFNEYIDMYNESFAILVPSDNEIAREYIDKMSKSIVISSYLSEALLKAFPSSSPKGKENIAKFLAICFESQVPTKITTNFVDLASKEISSDVTLSCLIQCAASLDQTGIEAFLKAHFKGSQKFSTKAAILLGIVKSRNYTSISEDMIKDIFTAGFVKEASLSSSSHHAFFVSSFSILVNRPDIKVVDSKILDDSIIALSKSSGAAIFCEKGFSSMDNSITDTLLSQVIIPVVFEDHCPSLFNACILAYSWFSVHGKKAQFGLIKKRSSALSAEKIDLFAKALEKVIDTPNEEKASRIWSILSILCDQNSLSSAHLALLCHDKYKLLGLGFGSWAELVRSRIPDIPQYCKQFYEIVILPKKFIDDSGAKTSAFYLLETLISLSPELIKESINLVDSVSSSLRCILSFSPVQWELLYPPPKQVSDSKPQGKVSTSVKTAIKSSNSSPVAEDASTTKEAILSATHNLKQSIGTILAASFAVPFHPNYCEVRPSIIMQVLTALPKLFDPKISAFITDNLYSIASESFDGQGPLLISLYLRSIGLESLISGSWMISEDYLLAESAYQVITRSLVAIEIDFALLVVAKSIKLFRKLSDLTVLKDLFMKLQTVSTNVESCDSRNVFDFVHALIEASRNLPKSHIALLVGLFIELAEIPDLKICSEHDILKLNRALRSESPQTQLLILKFLTAFVASHRNESEIQALANSELVKTIWLLHFQIDSQAKDLQSIGQVVEDENDDDVLDPTESTDAYELAEISTVASELCSLLGLGNGLKIDFLSELVLLETEKGRNELFVHNLLESYISALGHGLTDSSFLEGISREFERLHSTRTIPNGIVRLTKNVDRSKLDFTKQTRKALLKAVALSSKLFSTFEGVEWFLNDLVSFCFKVGFNDCDEVNCEIVFSTVLGIIDSCQREAQSEALFDQLQGSLNSVPSGNDRVKVYAVILVGRASSKVPSFTASPTRVFDLIEKVRGSLDIPSEKVQKAVADTLVPLFRSLSPEDKRIGIFVYEFSGRLRNATEDYGCLRGAAFGLAALIEACGTGIIRNFDIFNVFTGGLGNKKNEASACASLAAIEIVAIRCGTAFEPYIAPLVPGVLEALGDSKGRVREDAEACADAMMTALSPLSVSLILPPLLDMAGMDGCDPRYSWRTKLGAVTWLGSMANLAPKVLTTALPRIIPALIVALTDAHEKVHLAAHHALAVKYASIIRSPEIKAALPAILRALSDPPKFAAACLGDIIGTSFCHAVDGPSLALLEPLLSRALRERGTGAMSEAKRRAILIIANLGSLMDPMELKPYLVNLVPALRGVLGDAVPQVRSGAARTLGTLVKMMNSDRADKRTFNYSSLASFDDNSSLPPVLLDIVPECLNLISCSLPSVSAIDRAGAALAIAQVSAARGMDYLIALVNKHVAPILFTAESTSANGASREALLHLCAALPAALPSSQVAVLYSSVFTPDRIFTILQGCASEDEGVREISTKTVRSLLLRQALLVDLRSALDILLQGASDGRWRLRLTSFTILADLLPVLSLSGGEDSTTCDTKTRTVSSEMRAKLLSRLFFGRFDTNGLIRNAAFSLWKSIVTHPPRVILEILPVIVDDCVKLLNIEEFEDEEEPETDEEFDSENSDEPESEVETNTQSSAHKLDRYEMASSALQDILVKLSDRILLPFLRRLDQVDSVSCGILLAARIVASVVIVPNLIPPHQRSPTDVIVSVGRSQIDESLKIVLSLTQKGLVNDESEETVRVAVGLFAKISTGLTSSPALFDRIINDLFFTDSSSGAALVSVLNRRPQMLLLPLVNRFKKTSREDLQWDWWTDVLAAPGPFLAPQASSLLNHVLLKLECEQPHWPLIDVLLASMASYDPDMSYGDCEGDDKNDEDADAELENGVDTGLFGFAQLLETLWSAKNMTALAASLIAHFAAQGSYGIDRFYDIWLDRLLQAVCASGVSSNSPNQPAAQALVAVIEMAVERGDATTVISAFNQCIQVRSQVSRSLAYRLFDPLLIGFIKTLSLPSLTDTTLPSSDRLEACNLLQSVLMSREDPSPANESSNISRLSGPACTALLGALIRCLSDRSDTAKTERLKAGLLPILLFVLRQVPVAVGKPFHPQLARLAVNVLKDLVAAVSIAGNPIDTDQSHPRGQIALSTTQLVAFLLTHMSRVDVLLDELQAFRVLEDDESDNGAVIYDELSTRNARKCLLFVFEQLEPSISGSPNVSNLAGFIESTVKAFLVLPRSEMEVINSTAKIGLKLAPKVASVTSTDLQAYINNLV